MKPGWVLVCSVRADSRSGSRCGNHVGKPLPEFVHGDGRLFCYRNDIGSSWQKNTHGVSLRTHDDAPELVAKLTRRGMSNFSWEAGIRSGS